MKFSRAKSILSNLLMGAEAFPWTTKAANLSCLTKMTKSNWGLTGTFPLFSKIFTQKMEIRQTESDRLALKNVCVYIYVQNLSSATHDLCSHYQSVLSFVRLFGYLVCFQSITELRRIGRDINVSLIIPQARVTEILQHVA